MVIVIVSPVLNGLSVKNKGEFVLNNSISATWSAVVVLFPVLFFKLN